MSMVGAFVVAFRHLISNYVVYTLKKSASLAISAFQQSIICNLYYFENLTYNIN